MNKIYFFTADEERGGYYIAAENHKTAKAYAVCDPDGLFDFCSNKFIEMRGHMCRENHDSKGKPIYTEKVGILNIKDMELMNLLWFSCGNYECGGDDLEVIDDKKYQCRQCGHIGDIPYI